MGITNKALSIAITYSILALLFLGIAIGTAHVTYEYGSYYVEYWVAGEAFLYASLIYPIYSMYSVGKEHGFKEVLLVLGVLVIALLICIGIGWLMAEAKGSVGEYIFPKLAGALAYMSAIGFTIGAIAGFIGRAIAKKG